MKKSLPIYLLLIFTSLGAWAQGIEPLDGVKVEALETYQNPKTSQFDFGLGVWPLSAYYSGFSADLGYTYYFDKTLSWEVVHGDYVYTVDKGLSSELAQNFGVNPVRIERLKFVVSSNFQHVHAYGKMIFAKEYVRYFRSSLLAGPAFLVTNKKGAVGVGGGWRFEIFVNNRFSWKMEIRDVYALSSLGNSLSFIFGTAYAF